ncbi:hypothetical protein [Bartonella machadoae]|uniref:hypothetical protein n=1 Tax=Bartonella machadoae TaxID=2893471 RepID=UPI001F4C9B62|nr:hypothetical protein [Bartonella machadoae]UNE53944.1 hypothetical protein LNM86_10225 [Bartonella machadoae]
MPEKKTFSSFFEEKKTLSKQDYKRIFYISVVMMTAPFTFFLGLQIVCGFLGLCIGGGYDFLSFTILQPLAWILGCALVFSPIIWVLHIIVTRKLKKMIQQLEEQNQR